MKTNPKQIVTEALKVAFVAEFGEPTSDIVASVASVEGERGEYASSIALRESKRLKKAPIEVAEKVAKKLAKAAKIAKIEVAKPGFINITLVAELWRDWLNQIDEHSFSAKPDSGQSISLEFVSANPTGPLVLTNAWQAYFGDILARVYANAGYKVTREYYFNDSGSQVLNLGRSIQKECGARFDKETLEQLYKGDYVAELAQKISQNYGDEARVAEADSYEIGEKTAELLFDVIKAGLMRMGVSFDIFYSETKLDTDALIKLLENKKVIFEQNGAVWLKKEVCGTEEDQVLVRSAGKGETYFLKDIAYQLTRVAERQFDSAISVVGPDHHGQALRLTNTLKYLGYDNFTMLGTQTVRLVAGGKEVKMSKRAGNFILLEDFLDAVPSDVARFYFGSRDINSHLDLDLDKLKEQSVNNPLYYCNYGYARTCSILSKAHDQHETIAKTISHELSEPEQELAKTMAELPSILAEITQTQRVHNLINFLIEFSTRFSRYYENDRVLSIEDAKLKASKLAYLTLIAQFYETVFALIGVVPTEKM